MTESTRNVDVITERYEKGGRLKAETLNKIIDALNALHRRQNNRAADANLWFRCVSDDDADPFSILEVYDATFDDDEPTLLVRQVTNTAELYCGNENYPLFSGNPGWVKVIHCAPDFVQVRAVGGMVLYDDALDVQDFNVTSLNAAGSGSGSGGALGPLVAMTSERDFDRMVMVAKNCHGLTTDSDTTGCCAGCRCYPNDSIKVTACAEVPCLYPEYLVIGDLPFINNGLLSHAGGCTYESDAFPVEICDCDYGTGTWTLEIGSAPWTSTLTLEVTGGGSGSGSGSGCVGDAFTVVYKSKWYFDAICGNNFGKVFDCSIPPEVAHLFPCEVCVVANESVCPTCPTGGVSSECCVDGMPSTINATLQSFMSNCGNASIDGVTVAMTYLGTDIGGVLGYHWEGTNVVGGACGTLKYHLHQQYAPSHTPPGDCGFRFYVYKDSTHTCLDSGQTHVSQCPLTSHQISGMFWNSDTVTGCPTCCTLPGPVTVTLTP